MTERKDERRLDERLRRAIGGTTPVFDVQLWKSKHHQEYEMLLSRREQSARGARRVVFGRWAATLAAAAVVLAVALLIPGPPPARAPQIPPRTVADSAAGMMSMMSLRMAYVQGDFDGLDRQLQNTLDEFGPRSSSVSLQELL